MHNDHPRAVYGTVQTMSAVLCMSQEPCIYSQVADFGLSRQTISSKVETNTYGTGMRGIQGTHNTYACL